MKNKIMWIAFATLATTLIMGCSKKDHIDEKSRKELLISNKWQVIAILSIDSAGNEKDIYSGLDDYQKDDYYIFNADSTYELSDNISVRNDTVSNIIDAGTWKLIQNDSHLEMRSNIFATTYQPALIKELTGTSLFLETTFVSDRSVIRTWYRSF